MVIKYWNKCQNIDKKCQNLMKYWNKFGFFTNKKQKKLKFNKKMFSKLHICFIVRRIEYFNTVWHSKMDRNSDSTFYWLCLVVILEGYFGIFGFRKFCGVPSWGFCSVESWDIPGYRIFIKILSCYEDVLGIISGEASAL